MSVSHKFELALHLKSLQNISIRQTCYLQLRTIVYHIDPKSKTISAKPYQILNFQPPQPHSQQQFQPLIQDDTFLSPKIVIKNMVCVGVIQDKNVNMNCLCLFKGEIQMPCLGKLEYQYQIFVYCELIWFQGKEMEVIGDWRGYSKLTNFQSYLDIYFSTHILTCSVTASAHCILTDISLNSHETLSLSSKQPKFYNHITKKPSQLYQACIDPLIESLSSLAEWITEFKRNHLEEIRNKEMNGVIQICGDKGKWRYWDLGRKLGRTGDGELGKCLVALGGNQYMENLKKDSSNILSTMYPLWKHFLTLLKKYPQSPYILSLKQKYHKSLQKDHWLNRIILTGTTSQHLKQVFQQKGQQLEFSSVEQHVSKIRLSGRDMEILSKAVDRKKIKLVVLVHGFQASAFDMENIGMYFKFRNPDCYLLISQANQGMTQGVIEECGHRLAVQIKNYINSRELKDFSISFIGHSLGGIIIRASLRYLQLYKSSFQCYISICSPHMGYLYHTSKIVTTSLWVLNQVKKDQSMIELAMSDNKDLTKCYMYQLSEREELGLFRTVVFMGSREDQYVPYSSAVLEDVEFFYQSQSAKTFKTMFNNIVRPIEDKLVRLQILFNDRIKDLSGFIGRTAHIKVLSFLPIIDLYCHLISKRI